MPISKEELDNAIKHLWKTVPVGSGKDFNTVIKYIEYMRARVNEDATW